MRNIPPKTLVLIGVLVTLAVVLLGVAIKFAGNPQNLTPSTLRPTPTIEKTAEVSFTPSIVDLTGTSSSASVEVVTATGKNPITGVQVELIYDPTVISNVRLTPPTTNSLLGNPGSYITLFTDNKPGSFTYAVAISPTAQEVTGTGSIGTITFTVVKGAKAETQITLGAKTAVTSTAAQGSILNTSTPLTVKLQ